MLDQTRTSRGQYPCLQSVGFRHAVVVRTPSFVFQSTRKLREGDWLDLTLSDKCRGNDVIDCDSTDDAVEPKRVDGATEC